MKFGYRKPSFNKRLAARTSVKRYLRHSMGWKAPKGWGWLTDPKKAAYNKIYNKTSAGCLVILPVIMGMTMLLLLLVIKNI
ncbi:hypothetical protein ACFS6H_11700 [Terrimonas rubra]|uniref:DUF5808 domain-containing protein n=1 Tax=Terrimonas rubra TaxID=1035890 RepID=A0ABW6A7E0_9BACT